jgi:methyltransferase (TIGR00027 family)
VLGNRASRTALRVAQRRAVHQVLDQPCVLCDPIAVPLLGSHFAIDAGREAHPVARAFRAYMAARSRFAEDQLTQAISSGAAQYVILGAGLDTFAYRNRWPQLRVFEVDFPATQAWKRELLADAGIVAPANLTFVPLDFEHKTLTAGLADAGFDAGRSAFFGWLGVVPYLTRPAFQATVETIAHLPAGTGVTFDYGLSPKSLSLVRRMAFHALAKRVAAAGEPFRLLFTPDELEQDLRRAGFRGVQQRDADELNGLYFSGRSDGLRLPSPGLGMLVTAWV